MGPGDVVGTGPFKLVQYKRDNYLKWVRNENYWQPGKPYLDGIPVRYISEAATASAMTRRRRPTCGTVLRSRT